MWGFLRHRVAAVTLSLTALFPQIAKVQFFGAKTGTVIETAAADVAQDVSEVSTMAEEVASKPIGSAVKVGAGAAAGGAAAGGAMLAARGCEEAGGGKAITEVAENIGKETPKVAETLGQGAEGFAGNGIKDGLKPGESFSGAGQTILEPVPSNGLLLGPVVEDGSAAAAKASREAKISIFDESGEKISAKSLEGALVEEEFQERLARITADALQQIPGDASKLSDQEIESAILKALKKEPKLTYEFTANGGKLKLKYKAGRGEFSGEVNAISVVKKAAVIAAGYCAYYADCRSHLGPRALAPVATAPPGPK